MAGTQSPTPTLAAVVQLLRVFHHRNKNQHRLTKWWAQFDLLRRAIQKLDANLATSPRLPAVHSDIECRAAWLRDHVIPPSYLAFTQLAADNAFAPLGLFLLGVLARINSVLGLLLPRLPAVAEATSHKNERNKAVSPLYDGNTGISREDVGIAISREELRIDAPDSWTAAVPDVAGSTAEQNSRDKRPLVGTEPQKRKKRRKHGDEFTDLFGSL